MATIGKKSVKNRILIGISAIGAFVIVTYVFFQWIPAVGATHDVSAALGLVAGSFATYIVLATSGIISEFSVKGGLFEFSSKIEKEIKDTRKEIEDRISFMNQNLNLHLQSVYSKMDNVVSSTSASVTRQSTTLNLGDLVGQIGNLLESEKIKKISDAGVGKEIVPSKPLSLPKRVEEDVNEIEDIQKKVEELRHKLEKMSSIDIDKAMKEANLFFYLGKYDEAKVRYKPIINQAPQNVQVLVNYGIILYRLGEYREADIYFEKALAIDQNNFDALVYKSFILYRFGSREDAKRYYEKIIVIPIDEKKIDALVNKGIAFDYLGKHDEAISVLEKALMTEIDPNNVDALINKGVALDYLGRYKEGIQFYEKALQIDPNNIFALYSEACNYALQSKTDKSLIGEALNRLKRVIDLCPGYKEIAKKDPDFEHLAINEAFMQLVQEPTIIDRGRL